MRFKKNIKFRLIKMEQDFYITDHENVYKLNEMAARIFELCNGQNTTIEIAGFLKNKYMIDERSIHSDIEEYLLQLSSLGLVELCSQ